MAGSRVYYAKQNKSERKRQIPYDFTHMWNLKNKTNEQTTKQTQIQRTNRWLEGRGVGG